MNDLQNERKTVKKVVKGNTIITYIDGKLRCKHNTSKYSTTSQEFDENEKLTKISKNAEYSVRITGYLCTYDFKRDVLYSNEEIIKETLNATESDYSYGIFGGKKGEIGVVQNFELRREGKYAKLIIEGLGDKYFSSFENGIPVGDYKMPINLDFSDYFPPEKIGKGWTDSLQSLQLLKIRSDKIFSKDCNRLIAEGTVAKGYWKDGKFTGKAESEDFSAVWIDGEIKEAYLHDDSIYEDTKDYHWHDGVCDVTNYSTKGDIVEKKSEYTLRDGKKHGFEKFYNSDGTVKEMKYWQDGKDFTAKYNKLKSIASKRIEKEKQIEAETGIKTCLPKMSMKEKKDALRRKTLELS